jgi:hypothetical protein
VSCVGLLTSCVWMCVCLCLYVLRYAFLSGEAARSRKRLEGMATVVDELWQEAMRAVDPGCDVLGSLMPEEERRRRAMVVRRPFSPVR